MEKLGGRSRRQSGEGKVFVSWRLLGTEPASIGFTCIAPAARAKPVKLNDAPLTKATCFQDTGVDFPNRFVHRSGGPHAARNRRSKAFKFPANAPVRPYISIPLKEGLTPNDGAVGDLDAMGNTKSS